MAWWQYIIKTIIIIIFVVGVISMIRGWGSYLIKYGNRNLTRHRSKQLEFGRRRQNIKGYRKRYHVEDNKTSQGKQYDKNFRWKMLKIIGLTILCLLSMSLIVITIIFMLYDYNNLPWWRIFLVMLLFLVLVFISFISLLDGFRDVSENISAVIVTLIWFSIAGGFPYVTIYEKSNDKISEWKVKSTVKNYLKENSNDGSVEIVKWHEYCVLTENKYRQQPYDYYVKVTVRLKNTYGAKVIHTFHFYLQKKSKMQVEKCDPPVSSVITFAYPNSFLPNLIYHNTTLPRCPNSILAVVTPRALKTFTIVA